VDLPSGTVTFLFTDIEGSAQLWERYPQVMPAALAHHNTLLRDTIVRHGGVVFKTVGDAFCAAFMDAPNALAAALAAQRALHHAAWEDDRPAAGAHGRAYRDGGSPGG
jgi:class 3 adenylate cyclase